MEKEMDYILVAGYGWSGSSALVDILKEFDDCCEPGVEFRVIKDPYGIEDLYKALVEKWDPLNTDMAIKDFVWHMKYLNQLPNKLFMEVGLGYEKIFENNFMQKTYEFVDKLIDFDYESRWWFFDFKSTKLEILNSKLKRNFFPKVSKEKMYFSNVTSDEFCEFTRNYIDELFFPIIKEKNIKHIVLDQAIAVQNYKREMNYIRNSKLIVVDRDPRDIYTDLLAGNNLIGRELAKTHDVSKYIKWHKAYRENLDELKNDPNVLYLHFEDLIYNYDRVLEIIADFIGSELEKQSQKFTFFDPNISKKNVGIWKMRLSMEEKEMLEKELREYLVNEYY